MIIKKLVWDQWNGDHIARHNVTQDEIKEVCASKNIFNKWKNKVYRVIGQTDSGRYLTIFLSPRSGQSYYPVTARNATNTERKAFRRK